ncbi:hypothetical protein CLV78_101345 [Aliiruegeria haliotis]|uniref:Probable membrane transporter protein n=1 Tax=Aliiruegeria haliotis TaxID=1280846 RepID=A0A2T0RYL8_9RHOB|nr:sulfite exporter TauE/SafE family protein [Aliiruegeria haliotis]PRY26250.1 hypothetical protein CLV78_101345 [Aliiruegeria haliotis]
MPDLLAEAWQTPGLAYLALVIGGAGLVRGFAGFGTGLIFIPLGSLVLDPVWVIVALMAADLVGTLPLVPRAVRDGRLRDVAALVLGCAIMLPLGTMVLERLDDTLFRWIASGLALLMVAVLASGWRHHIVLNRRALVAVGGLGGFLGGTSGLPGPPVVFAYMSGQYPAQRIRANTLLFLLLFEFLLAATFLLRGLFVPQAFAIGVLLIVPYIIGNLLGARIFDPRHARLYRTVAYVIIAGSAIAALPVF